MAKNRKTPDMNLPVWFDGQNINEALFCEEFLQESRIIFANRAFFTPNGRVTDDIVLRGEVYEKLKSYTISSVPQKIKNIMELLKLEAMVEDLPSSLTASMLPTERSCWMEDLSRGKRKSYRAACLFPTIQTLLHLLCG